MFIVAVNFTVHTEHVKEFHEAVRQQANVSLKVERDCHLFDVCIDRQNPASVFLYEKYTDADAFDAHLASTHFESFDALVAPWVESKTVTTWQILGWPE